MKLDKKKQLAVRTLRVGNDRIWFNPERLADIKEAITKQDIKDLVKDKAIKIKPITGKLKKEKKKRRHEGKIKKKIKRRKKKYIIKIRKLRKYLKVLKNNNEIGKEDYHRLRRYAKSGIFTNLKHLKDYVISMKKAGKIKTPEKEKEEKGKQKKKEEKAEKQVKEEKEKKQEGEEEKQEGEEEIKEKKEKKEKAKSKARRKISRRKKTKAK